jgi:AcrR family transcriptional regulator
MTKTKKADPAAAALARAAPSKPRAKPVAARAPASRKATERLPAGERRARILQQAFEYFSDHGLNAQTRALAEACGVSQRLLYSLFPNKSSLIQAVYDAEIAGPFKAVWFIQLRDRSVPMQDRLVDFYCDYYDTILTRRWLRLFIWSSLADAEMAPAYITGVVRTLLEAVVQEAVLDAGLQLPQDPALLQELGWVLHGNVSHLGIRRHIYGNASAVPVRQAITMHVAAFLAALPVLCGGDGAG